MKKTTMTFLFFAFLAGATGFGVWLWKNANNHRERSNYAFLVRTDGLEAFHFRIPPGDYDELPPLQLVLKK